MNASFNSDNPGPEGGLFGIDLSQLLDWDLNAFEV